MKIIRSEVGRRRGQRDGAIHVADCRNDISLAKRTWSGWRNDRGYYLWVCTLSIQSLAKAGVDRSLTEWPAVYTCRNLARRSWRSANGTTSGAGRASACSSLPLVPSSAHRFLARSTRRRAGSSGWACMRQQASLLPRAPCGRRNVSCSEDSGADSSGWDLPWLLIDCDPSAF